MIKVHGYLVSAMFGLMLLQPAQAGHLRGFIVEENGGPVGNVRWTVVDKKGFLPVGSGKGHHISVQLKPGHYIVNVDGDTQASEQVLIEKGVTVIRVRTRKFY